MNSSEEEDSISDGEERCSEKFLIKLENSTGRKLTIGESKMLNTYTYDKEPVLAWRKINDFIVIKECYAVKWSKITELLGRYNGYFSSSELYNSSKSCLVNLIEKNICTEKCYFFPAKCLMSHGYHLKI